MCMKILRYIISAVLVAALFVGCFLMTGGEIVEVPSEGDANTLAEDPALDENLKSAKAQELRSQIDTVNTAKAEKKKEEERKRKEEEEKRKKAEEEKRRREEEALRKALELPDTGHYVDPEWFDDAVFVGDSLTNMLSMCSESLPIGNADFVCAPSLGYNNALWNINRSGNVHPLYRGKKVTAFEGVKKSGRKKVFIMLGMNDIGVYGLEGAVDGLREFKKKMLEVNPDVKLYFQSVKPMLKNKQRNDLNNKNIPEFDKRLKEFCDENGYRYINVTPAVWDGKGNLLPDYCGDPDDMGLHPNITGCERWVDCLRRYVETDKELAEEAKKREQEASKKAAEASARQESSQQQTEDEPEQTDVEQEYEQESYDDQQADDYENDYEDTGDDDYNDDYDYDDDE